MLLAYIFNTLYILVNVIYSIVVIFYLARGRPYTCIFHQQLRKHTDCCKHRQMHPCKLRFLFFWFDYLNIRSHYVICSLLMSVHLNWTSLYFCWPYFMVKFANFNNNVQVCVPNYGRVACCVPPLCLVRTDQTPMNTGNQNGSGVGGGLYSVHSGFKNVSRFHEIISDKSSIHLIHNKFYHFNVNCLLLIRVTHILLTT